MAQRLVLSEHTVHGTWPTSSASSASPPAPRPRPGARAPGLSENSEQPRYKRRPPRLPTAQWRTEPAAKCDTLRACRKITRSFPESGTLVWYGRDGGYPGDAGGEV